MKEYGRLGLVVVLMFVFVIGIFGEPNEDLAIAEWLLTFLASKLIGLLAGLAAYKLAQREVDEFVRRADHE